jgi:N-methylhydantoinase A
MLQSLDMPSINSLFASMITEARDVVRQGAPDAPIVITRTAFMRYNGQGHEIEIALPDRTIDGTDLGPLTLAFEKAYTQQFSRPVPGMEIEILNWAVRVGTHNIVPQPVPKIKQTRDVAVKETCEIRCDITGAVRSAALVQRASLQPGDCLRGPALIVEPQTTSFVGADFAAEVDARGNIILTRDLIGA